MRYFETIIGSHAPPTVLASSSEILSGTSSMNGGTIAMMKSGTESETENQNIRTSAWYALACASACTSTTSEPSGTSILTVAP